MKQIETNNQSLTRAFHGIRTCMTVDSRSSSYEGLMLKAFRVIEGAEICTSDCPLWEIGLIVEGNLTMVAGFDLFSIYDPADGRRFHELDPNKGRSYGEESLYVHWTQDALVNFSWEESNHPAGNQYEQYCEFWHKNCRVIGVWTSAIAGPVMKTIAERMAKELDVEVIHGLPKEPLLHYL